jgi:uncharacterized protein (DUF4415 family)
MKKTPDKLVRYDFDPAAPPPLTARQKKEIAALASVSDAAIDTSDIPSSSFDTADAVRGRFYRPRKAQITARVDADVLDWLKSQGRGYQGRMNAILRREMLTAMKRKDRA